MNEHEVLAHIATRYGKPLRANDLRIPCPAHGGDGLNLHITLKNGRVLYHCFSHGCEREAIESALGIHTDVPIPLPPLVRQHEHTEDQWRAEQAVREAERLMRAATYLPHPYLESKGFLEECGLVHQGKLIIPMRHYHTNALQSAQLIEADGSKRFLPGGKAGGAVFVLDGGRRARWRVYCEGFATALSIRAAMKALYQTAEVVVCFSAGNMPKVITRKENAFVVADKDWFSCVNHTPHYKWDAPYETVACPLCGSDKISKPAGEKYALQCGLPWWMPDETDTDANDAMQKYGLDWLADGLRPLIQRV